VFFKNLAELESVVEEETNVLIVLDDMMKETRYNATLEKLFTRGRHPMISIMSLEQDPFYSSHIERRNADYFVLTRMRDTSCLTELYKKFCRDIQQWRFIELYEYAVSKPLGYLVIDFVSQAHKYRINSLNLYYNTQTSHVNHITKDEEFKEPPKSENKRIDEELTHRFSITNANIKSRRQHFGNV